MADRFFFDIELPDLASSPGTPEAGFIQLYGLQGRPAARNSGGRVFEADRHYTADGEVTAAPVKHWYGIATTSDGAWTANISAAGFNAILTAQATGVGGGTRQTTVFASVDSVSTAAVSGRACVARASSLLGLGTTSNNADNGTQIRVHVVGV